MTDVVFLAEADPAETARLRGALEAAGVRAELRGTPDPVRSTTPRGAGGQPSPGLGPGVAVLSVFVGSRVDQPLLDACPDLRLVATRSTGYDHVDLAACAARGVAVANVPTYGENTVAEHTFALILALSRNVHKAWVRTQRGDFTIQGLQGFDLRGRVLGLIGVGHIGLHTAKIARGFGMRVLASDPRPQPLLAELVGFGYVELEELVAGAGLDVLEGEELLTEDRRRLALERDEASLRVLVENQLLAGREDVVVTPHVGFDSVEAVQRIAEVTAANVAAFLAGNPQNLVS